MAEHTISPSMSCTTGGLLGLDSELGVVLHEAAGFGGPLLLDSGHVRHGDVGGRFGISRAILLAAHSSLANKLNLYNIPLTQMKAERR